MDGTNISLNEVPSYNYYIHVRSQSRISPRDLEGATLRYGASSAERIGNVVEL
jgi:hypothetical protein